METKSSWSTRPTILQCLMVDIRPLPLGYVYAYFLPIFGFGVVTLTVASWDSLSVTFSLTLAHLNSLLRLEIGNFKTLFPYNATLLMTRRSPRHFLKLVQNYSFSISLTLISYSVNGQNICGISPNFMHHNFNPPRNKVLSILLRHLVINSLVLMICSASFKRSLYPHCTKLLTDSSVNIGIVTLIIMYS